MATSNVVLTPQEEYDLCNVPHAAGLEPSDLDPNHPQAGLCLELLSIGRADLASSVNLCGKTKIGDAHACGNVTNTHPIHCRKAAHRSCADFEAKNAVENLVYSTKHLETEHPDWHVTYVEVQVPHNSTPENTKELKERVKKAFLSLFQGALEAYRSKQSTKQRFHCASDGLSGTGELVFRLVTYGDSQPTLQQIREAFSWTSKVIPALGSIAELPRFFGFLMQPAIPKSPQLQAAMCVALEGVRKLENFGEVTEKLQRETSDTATSPQEGAPKKHRACPYCQSEYTGRVTLPENEYPRCQFAGRVPMIC